MRAGVFLVLFVAYIQKARCSCNASVDLKEECVSHCDSYACKALCHGDMCSSSCTGWFCEAFCEGKGCSSFCSGIACKALSNGNGCHMNTM
ncbi:unnamed protein product, partial [Iphiclides podalirius]